MSQKNETTILVLALLITAGLVGGGIWWFTHQFSGLTGVSTNRSQQGVEFTGETFAQVKGVPSGLFNYGGSTTWAPIRQEVDSAIQTVWPQFRLRYTQPTNKAPGSATGIEMLLNNQLAFAQSSRSITAEEQQQAKQLGFTLKEIPVAIDGIAIAVNPNLNIPGLTIAQLKDIYIGKVTNWRQLGGANIPIVPYSRRLQDSGTVEFFVQNILGGENFGANIKFIPTTTEALQQIVNNPGAIYYASAPEVVNQCTVKPLPVGRTPGQLIPPYKSPFVPLSQCLSQHNQINISAFQSGEYPITRNLFAIVKNNGQIEQQAGNAYANLLLTNQGQELISKTGFVRIR